LRFYINILTTYYPDLDPPYDVYYQQILEQIELAEELGWECFMFNEHHFLGYGGLVGTGDHSQGLAERALQTRGQVLEVSGHYALSQARATTPPADVGGGDLSADSGVGWLKRLRHHDGGPSAPAGKSARRGRSMEESR
jgi:hypothetical protein